MAFVKKNGSLKVRKTINNNKLWTHSTTLISDGEWLRSTISPIAYSYSNREAKFGEDVPEHLSCRPRRQTPFRTANTGARKCWKSQAYTLILTFWYALLRMVGFGLSALLLSFCGRCGKHTRPKMKTRTSWVTIGLYWAWIFSENRRMAFVCVLRGVRSQGTGCPHFAQNKPITQQREHLWFQWRQGQRVGMSSAIIARVWC